MEILKRLGSALRGPTTWGKQTGMKDNRALKPLGDDKLTENQHRGRGPEKG